MISKNDFVEQRLLLRINQAINYSKVAKMKISSKNERRSNKDRRSRKERRQNNNPKYNDLERRIVQERRLMQDKRSQIMCDRHFHY